MAAAKNNKTFHAHLHALFEPGRPETRATRERIAQHHWPDHWWCGFAHKTRSGGALVEAEKLLDANKYDAECERCLANGGDAIPKQAPAEVVAGKFDPPRLTSLLNEWRAAREACAADDVRVRTTIGRSVTRNVQLVVRERELWAILCAVFFDYVRPHVFKPRALRSPAHVEWVRLIGEFNAAATKRHGGSLHGNILRLWCVTHQAVGDAVPVMGGVDCCDAYHACMMCRTSKVATSSIAAERQLVASRFVSQDRLAAAASSHSEPAAAAAADDTRMMF